MLEIVANELRVSMTLTGVASVAQIDGRILANRRSCFPRG
jgi:isopentenyl diphosphate isomerase/L-lactate dehydrogenase-like FMN-dependent dehydrogenase